MAEEIPSDLLIEILKRLPVKSLARFKCVSKLWSSLIRSQGYFFASPPRLYISLISFQSTDIPSYKSVLLSLASTSENTAFDLDLMIDGIGGSNMQSLRGLILYEFFGNTFIYNPTTGQRVILPAIEFSMGYRHYFLGYDPVLDQYKVVCTDVLSDMYAEHWVFVLEAESSWKRIEFDLPHFPKRQRVCINGVIYYLAFSSLYGDNVISFDVRAEEFNTIQLPHAMSENLMSRYLGLIEYGGKPTIFDLSDVLVNLWVLEDCGKWSNKSLILQSCQIHLFRSSFGFQVIGTTQNDEVILKPSPMSYPYYIIYYDLHKNDLRRVDIRGISHLEMDLEKSTVYLTMMNTGESIMHLEI